MRECDKSKNTCKQQLPIVYMSFNNVGHLIASTITTLQHCYTLPHFTKLHFTTLIDTSLPLICTSLLSRLAWPIYKFVVNTIRELVEISFDWRLILHIMDIRKSGVWPCVVYSVCMYVCMYVCVYMYICMYICTYICTYVCMYVCTYACMCVYVCACVCVCVCMYVCMYYVCMYVFICAWTLSVRTTTRFRGKAPSECKGLSLIAMPASPDPPFSCPYILLVIMRCDCGSKRSQSQFLGACQFTQSFRHDTNNDFQ